MRIVIARLSVEYSGRGDTRLPAAVRAILIKQDGAVSIHADMNGNKPLNYMSAPNTFTQTRRGRQIIWTFRNRKETLTVRIHSLISDTSFALDTIEPGLTRARTEKDLQAWLAAHPSVLGDDVRVVHREYPTGSGPVDLLAITDSGQAIAIEVKRTAMLGAVDQVLRYTAALNASGTLGPVAGMIVAVDIRPNTAALAAVHGITCRTVPSPD